MKPNRDKLKNLNLSPGKNSTKQYKWGERGWALAPDVIWLHISREPLLILGCLNRSKMLREREMMTPFSSELVRHHQAHSAQSCISQYNRHALLTPSSSVKTTSPCCQVATVGYSRGTRSRGEPRIQAGPTEIFSKMWYTDPGRVSTKTRSDLPLAFPGTGTDNTWLFCLS